jgi:hypothetical protein
MQKFKDWTLVEAKDFGTFKYNILKVTDQENKSYLRGWVFAKNGSTWLESESLEALRANLMTFGRQNG